MGDTDGQPPRRRGETRYCRVPQWLYASGVSLQAIATYGWLHGKYGFLPVIKPSYATLAEELHCSRGSVITYLKELVTVGAVRITVGGPKGRTINTYEIAFDAPFAFASGQPADHLKGADTSGVVSPLTSSGQSADQTPGQSGQRAVPEKEEVLKTEEDSLSSSASTTPAEPPAAPSSERENKAAPDKPTAAQRAIRSSGAISADEEQDFITWCTAKFNVKHAGWWKTCADDLPEHAAVWRGERAGFGAPRVRQLPDWCRVCGEDNPAAEFNPKFRRTAAGAKCPDCHPDAAAAA